MIKTSKKVSCFYSKPPLSPPSRKLATLGKLTASFVLTESVAWEGGPFCTRRVGILTPWSLLMSLQFYHSRLEPPQPSESAAACGRALQQGRPHQAHRQDPQDRRATADPRRPFLIPITSEPIQALRLPTMFLPPSLDCLRSRNRLSLY